MLSILFSALPLLFRFFVPGGDYGNFLKSSSILFISHLCLISSTLPTFLHIIFDIYGSVESGNKNEEKIQSKTFKTFPYERFSILCAFVFSAVMNITVTSLDLPGPIVGTATFCILVAEVSWVMGSVFYVAESLWREKGYFKNKYYTCISLYIVAVVVIAFFNNYPLGRIEQVILFAVILVLYVVLTVFLAALFAQIARQYSLSYDEDPGSEKNWEYATLFTYASFGAVYAFGSVVHMAEVWLWVEGYRTYTIIFKVTFSTLKIVAFSFLTQVAGRAEKFQLHTMQQTLRERTRFVRYISHEVRSPLNVVGVGATLLESIIFETALNGHKELLDTVDSIKLACKTATETLDDVLHYDKLCSNLLTTDLFPVTVETLIAKSLTFCEMLIRSEGMIFDVPTATNYLEFSQLLVHVDLPKIAICFRNLIANSLKFTQSGGSISVKLSCVDENEVYMQAMEKTGSWGNLQFRIKTQNQCFNDMVFRCARKSRKVQPPPPRRYLWCDIVDTGCGIKAEDIPKLFKQDIQLNPNRLQDKASSGFGLLIAAGIIKLHNGAICVQSEGIGRGSTFSIILPLFETDYPLPPTDNPVANESAGPDPLRNPQRSDELNRRVATLHESEGDIEANVDDGRCGARNRDVGSERDRDIEASKESQDIATDLNLWLCGKSILLVDDVPACNKVVGALLKRKGALVEFAEDGQVAVEMVRERMREQNKCSMSGECQLLYDLILMDNSMPVMNGPCACTEIRSLSYTGLIFGLTGNMLKQDVDEFLSSGADDVISKPLTLVKFQASLNSINRKAVDVSFDNSQELSGNSSPVDL